MKISKLLKISVSAILSLALIASIIVIPAVSAETTTDYNLIKNGSFEAGTLDGWNKSSGSNFSVVKATDTGIAACDNEYVLKIAGASGWPYVGREGSNAITVVNGETYVFSFYVYRVSSTSEAVFKLGNASKDTAYNYNSSQQYLNGGGIGNNATGTWIKVTRTFTATDNTVKLYFSSNGAAKDILYIDNVSLKKVVSITATAETGGTVSGLPTTAILAGDSITLSATANKGYTVDGWYNGDTKVTDSAIYSFTATENADLTAKFTVDPAVISDGGFEDETLNKGWKGGDHLKVTTADKYAGKQSALLEPTGSWQNANYQFMVEKNKYYAVRFMAKNAGKDGVIKVTTTTNTSTNILDGGSANGGNLAIGATSNWSLITKTFYSGDNTNFNLFLVRNGNNATKVYIDNLQIVERVTVTATAEENGTVTPESSLVAIGGEATVAATPNKGYLFEGWYNGDTLVSTTTPYTFTVAGNTALTAKFIADDTTNLVVNGSFEGALVSGWNATTYPDFTSVKAADKGISAVDGERVLDVTKAASWNWNYTHQNIAVEKDKTYKISFWVYKTATANNAMYKLGTSKNEKEYVADRYFNYGEYVNAGRWLYVSHTINSTDTTLKMALVSHTGTVYIDDIRVVEADSIGNLVENGDMSNAAKALNVWTIGNSSCFSYDATAEGYTGTGALKVTGSSSASWANAKYTFSVKANTDYVFRFYAKNAVAGKKSVYKILGADNKTYMFNGKDAYTNGDGANGDGTDWGKNEWRFNSGENTTLYLYFVEIDNVTYIDDIYLGEAIAATCASSNKALGTVNASKAYVGEDDEVTYTATATAGGKFLGWRVGDSDTLVEGETFTYKGFDDLALTAVFEAALGNVNSDSAIDGKDIAALRNSVLGSAEYTALGDMNANSTNDIRDLVALYKTISK